MLEKYLRNKKITFKINLNWAMVKNYILLNRTSVSIFK